MPSSSERYIPRVGDVVTTRLYGDDCPMRVSDVSIKYERANVFTRDGAMLFGFWELSPHFKDKK